MPRKPIRVLIVDDSALTRAVLRRAFESDGAFEVIATAANAYEARDLLVRQRPDLMTLDINMPRIDGQTFLEKTMALLPTPTVVFSSAVSESDARGRQLLETGAAAVVKKSSTDADGNELLPALELVRVAKQVAGRGRGGALRSSNTKPAHSPQHSSHLVGLGASTGGVAALGVLIPQLPVDLPAVVVVQHMPEGFTANFAKRMNSMTSMKVREAADGETLMTGHIYVAPGGARHCLVRKSGAHFVIRLEPGPPEKGHRPSVDRLFESLGKHAGPRALGCLLTGMGNDGAAGLLAMRQAGSRTIAQAKEGCAVWGMPGAAVACGAAELQVPLAAIAETIVRLLPRGAGGAPDAASLAPSAGAARGRSEGPNGPRRARLPGR